MDDEATARVLVDEATLNELDDAIAHLDGAQAALRDLRARLAVGV